MLAVVTFRWRPFKGYRSQFPVEAVSVLANMLRRNAPPHRFFCVTDEPEAITDPRVNVYPLWDDLSDVPNPFGQNPSCYRRLKLFSEEAKMFGDKIVCMDLDCVVTGDLTPLWERDEDFMAWAPQDPRAGYNGSMWMVKPGRLSHVWEDFDPKRSPQIQAKAGCFGSDQGWLSYKIPGYPTWGTEDGVYSYKTHVRKGRRGKRPTPPGVLPDNARVVFFHGKEDPWDLRYREPFILEHWR